MISASVDKRSVDILKLYIDKLPEEMQLAEMRTLLRKSAEPAKKAIAQKAPRHKNRYTVFSKARGKNVTIKRSDTIARYKHSRYGKGNGRRKGVQDGEGVINAYYLRGNLQKSVKIKLGRSKKNATVWVGPIRGGTPDGWYKGFVTHATKRGNKPNPFVAQGWQASKATVLNGASKELKKYAKSKLKRLGLQ